MKFNKTRKLKIDKRIEKIISHFNQLYPYEFILEYLEGKRLEWVEFCIEGNWDLTYELIKSSFEELIRDKEYKKVYVEGNKIYLKGKDNNNKLIKIWKSNGI